jgi:hypothetical protein
MGRPGVGRLQIAGWAERFCHEGHEAHEAGLFTLCFFASLRFTQDHRLIRRVGIHAPGMESVKRDPVTDHASRFTN